MAEAKNELESSTVGLSATVFEKVVSDYNTNSQPKNLAYLLTLATGLQATNGDGR